MSIDVKANELRSGNYLQGKPLSIPRMGIWSNGITQITAYGIYCIENDISRTLEPIPLTHEILKRCGFQTDEISYWYEFSFNGIVSYLTIGHYKDNVFRFLPTGSLSISGVQIKSVHQLQNLYFSLTNQELIYTP